jgi:dolichol-phosphate mannosyltransferase
MGTPKPIPRQSEATLKETPLIRPRGDALVAVLVYNEGLRIEAVLRKVAQVSDACDVLVIDDGSTDESVEVLTRFGFPVLQHSHNLGAGASVKDAIRYAKERDYRFIVMIAGNGKMDPFQIPQLLQPLRSDESDYVQGSRYLEGGKHENLPLFRNVMIRVFTSMVHVLTGFKGTDVTCGFRAYKLSLFEDPQIDIWQPWLDRYELEYYVHYKVIKQGYRLREMPVSMIYPTDGRPYSKIKPFSGWWSIVRPLVLLSLNIRH